MNPKQKLGYILLGAGIMAVGITIGQVITPDIRAQNNGVFDEIWCRKLTVYYDTGEPAIGLAATPQGSAILVLSPSGKKAVELYSDGTSNSMNVFNENAERTIQLVDKHDSGTTIMLSNDRGERAIALGSLNIIGNNLTLYDQAGNPAVEANSVMSGQNDMVIHDQNGNKAIHLKSHALMGNTIDIHQRQSDFGDKLESHPEFRSGLKIRDRDGKITGIAPE